MINLSFNDLSNIETKISIPEDAYVTEAFNGLYKAWLAMTYTDDQFLDMCKRYVEQGDLMFV